MFTYPQFMLDMLYERQRDVLREVTQLRRLAPRRSGLRAVAPELADLLITLGIAMRKHYMVQTYRSSGRRASLRAS